MDLRVAKTKNRIISAFLKLRDKLTLEKIKVKDICDEAMINKTTFYKHFREITGMTPLEYKKVKK